MTKSVSLRSISILSIAVASIYSTTPAYASEWTIVGAEPDAAPHRSLYVMQSDDAWISRRMADSSAASLADAEANTLHVAQVLQIFENAGGTNFIHYQVEYKCRQGMVSIPQATSYDRAGNTEKGGSPEWMKVPDNWLGKVEMIACNWKNWRAAKDGWQKQSQSLSKCVKSAVSPAIFASLGVEYLGNYGLWTDVVDGVWNTRWSDATQPAYYKGTPEELAAAKTKALATFDQSNQLLVEQQKWSKIATALSDKADRIGGDFGLQMAGVGGLTEEQVVRRWGTPAAVYERNGGRQITYYFQDTKYGVQDVAVDIVNTQGKVGETTRPELASYTRQCSRTFYLQEGGALEKAYRVYDFDIGCN